MKNKIIIIALTGALAFSASACGNGNTADDGQEETRTAAETEDESSITDEEASSASDGEGTASSILDAERVSEREDYVGLQDLDIDEYVTLNDYKNMKVTLSVEEADDESIESYINSELLTRNVTDRAVENGDVVNIDYVGKLDGEAFDNGSDSGYELTIGSGTFIDGFEEGLIGVMPGETVDLELTFPEDYGAEALAGKDTVFTVTVNGIVEALEYADITDDDVKALGLSYSTRDELWAAAKAAVEEEAFESGKSSAILNQILTESTIHSIPEYLVEEQIQSYEIYLESVCQMNLGMDFESYLQETQGMTLEEFEDDIYEDCETTVKQYLLMEALARAEGIDVTDELVREYAAQDIAGYDGYTVDTYLEEIGYTTYRMFVLQEQLVERLLEIIEVEPA
ncbi:MAG: trigger factor [Lachnospiraceae bacterium]|nr:trigger factor [Lachnospiraceae bacterium]